LPAGWRNSGLRWLWLAAAVVALDQLSKGLASSSLIPYRPLTVLPVLDMTLVHNTGAAFSFLSSAAGWQRWFFIGLTLAVSVGLVVWIKRLRPEDKWMAGALAMVLGGALGNLVDRIRFGRVTDFLDFHWHGWHWPAFNLADSAITIGVVVLILFSWRGEEPGREKQ